MSARLGSVLTLALLLGACIPNYEAPTFAQPHATIKVRRTYDSGGGSTLRELMMVDEHRVFSGDLPSRMAEAPLNNAALVHPIPATFELRSEFFHYEMRQVQESYYDSVPYTDFETYDCSTGFGATRTYNSCSRMVTRYRNELRYRWVNKLVEVSDGGCRAGTRFTPAIGGVYLLQYSYQEPMACSLSCFAQVSQPDGTFQNSPCPSAPPPAP